MTEASAPTATNPRTDDARRVTINVYDDPDSVATEWSELEANGALTPFQTRAWLLPWLRIVAPAHNVTPIFVLVREACSGRPLMLLPLCRVPQRGRIAIEFQDLGVTDYNAPLLALDYQPDDAAFEELWREITLALPKADLIALEKMPERIAGLTNPMARLADAKRMRLRAWTLPLPATREAYDKSLDRFDRKEFRRKRRNLETEGPLQFLHAQTETHALHIFETLRRQKQARGTGSLLTDTSPFAKFYLAVALENLKGRFALLSELKVGDETAATLFAINHGGGYLLLMHCFEEGRWGTKSPGIVAIDSALTDCIEAGATCLDFTIGNEGYKTQFGVQESFLCFVECGRSLVGHMLVAARGGRRFLGAQVRRLRQEISMLRNARAGAPRKHGSG